MSCFSHKHQSLWLFLWVDWLLLMLYGEGVIRRFRDVRRSAGVKYVVYTRNLMVLHILDHWHSSYLSLSVICPSSKGLLYHFFPLLCSLSVLSSTMHGKKKLPEKSLSQFSCPHNWNVVNFFLLACKLQ